jgi:universal stress protein E
LKDSILLIAAGPKQHTPALQRAFDLARRAEVPVHVGLFIHDALMERSAALIHPEVGRLARQQLLEEHQAWIRELVSRWKADGLAATGEVVWAPQAHEAIVAKILERKPALVIKDVGHEPLLKRITYTALDWKLVRYCPAPLMLVHGLSNRLPRQILAAVDTAAGVSDPAPLNELILRESLKLADWAEADVHLAHVFPYLPFAATPYPALDRVYFDTKSADREGFDAFAAGHDVPAAARHWLEGNPVDRLAELVKEQNIDLLVLGSTYRSSLDRLLIGSTAETMLFQIPCDMLLVKPAAFAETLAQALHQRAA